MTAMAEHQLDFDSEEPTHHDGMMPAEEWAQTSVHQHSTYSCGKCGARFDTPNDFYDHLDEEHS